MLLSIALAAGFPIEPEREYSALYSSCSRLCHHPVAGALYESDGHCFASFVILHADDASFRRTPFSSCLDPHVNCSAQSCSFAVSARPPDFPTSPLALLVWIALSLAAGTHYSPTETQTSADRDARWTPKDYKHAAVATCRNGEA